MFYRAGIIERWGTGTLNILDWCKENGNPPPTWKEQAGSVYVTFWPAVRPDQETETTGQVPDKYPGSHPGSHPGSPSSEGAFRGDDQATAPGGS